MEISLSTKYQIDNEFKNNLDGFLEQYGILGLKQALQLYRDTQQEYICKTRSSISKIRIFDIYYMEIHEHQITIYSQDGIFHKYGTLNSELKLLSSYGFIKCTQNCIVSLRKIRTICYNDIILTNNMKIHMSRKYAPIVIMAFSFK
ncbi:LytTR family transcriptional regulator [Lachnospiraceae bacterium]|nr:LytTR family transcriptional regulator [Lachnospiraceae bacterium]